MTKLSLTARALGLGAAALTLPLLATGPASASAGWDYVGYRQFEVSKAVPYVSTTDPVLSTGGNFRACVSSGLGAGKVVLWEQDTGADDRIGYGKLEPGTNCVVFSGITNHLDGTNKRAELYLRVDTNFTGSAKFYD